MQHFLNFLPLPQGQESLRPISRKGLRTVPWLDQFETPLAPRSTTRLFFGLKQSQSLSSSIVSPNGSYSLFEACLGRTLLSPSRKSSSKSVNSSENESMRPSSKA